MHYFYEIGKYASRGDRHVLRALAESSATSIEGQVYRLERYRLGDLIQVQYATGWDDYKRKLEYEIFCAASRDGIALMRRDV